MGPWPRRVPARSRFPRQNPVSWTKGGAGDLALSKDLQGARRAAGDWGCSWGGRWAVVLGLWLFCCTSVLLGDAVHFLPCLELSGVSLISRARLGAGSREMELSLLL